MNLRSVPLIKYTLLAAGSLLVIGVLTFTNFLPFKTKLVPTPMDEQQVKQLIEAWSERINDRADLSAILKGHIREVGSISFQYDDEKKLLIVRGIIYINTSDLNNPERAAKWLQEYADKHPETVGGAKIELLTSAAYEDGIGRIVLRLDMDKFDSESNAINAFHKLSKHAYEWRMHHIQKAIVGE